MSRKLRIAVIGAGLMGHGIALTLARAEPPVAITDPFEEARATVKDRIRASMAAMGCSEIEVASALKLIDIF